MHVNQIKCRKLERKKKRTLFAHIIGLYKLAIVIWQFPSFHVYLFRYACAYLYALRIVQPTIVLVLEFLMVEQKKSDVLDSMFGQVRSSQRKQLIFLLCTCIFTREHTVVDMNSLLHTIRELFRHDS